MLCVESRIIGPLYFALAIVAGFVGAALGHQYDTPHIVSHGVVMSLFLASPALLGGLGNGVLPARLSGGMRLLSLNTAGLVVYVIGLIALIGANAGITQSEASTLLAIGSWCFAMLALASVLLVSILEGQPRGRTMQAFVWSQAMGATAILIVVPVLLAALTDAMMGRAGVLTVLEHAMPWPVLPVVMAPICGVLAEIFSVSFDRLRGKATWFMAATGVMSPGLAVVWAHGAMAHDQAWSANMVRLGMALMVFVVLCQCLHAAWRQRRIFSPAMAWACGLIIVLTLGFAASLEPAQHSALGFALVFASFAGLYQWAAILRRSPGPMVWPHLALTLIGTSDVAIPGLVPQALAGSAMIAGLVCLGPVLLRVAAGPSVLNAEAGAHFS